MRDRLSEQQASSKQAPKLLSFKKTTSMHTFSPSSPNTSDTSSEPDELMGGGATQSADFEGSDDWIRLNFKWYLYTLLASVVKEDACVRLKHELEAILFSLVVSDASQSSDSSSASLENEVVNIDDYIEKVNSNGSGSGGNEQHKFDTLTTPRKKV